MRGLAATEVIGSASGDGFVGFAGRDDGRLKPLLRYSRPQHGGDRPGSTRAHGRPGRPHRCSCPFPVQRFDQIIMNARRRHVVCTVRGGESGHGSARMPGDLHDDC